MPLLLPSVHYTAWTPKRFPLFAKNIPQSLHKY